MYRFPGFSRPSNANANRTFILGIPTILRDVDGNEELKRGSNIILFDNDNNLENAMIKMATISKARNKRTNLLPHNYSKKEILKSYIELLND